jgi:hypothetical protein
MFIPHYRELFTKSLSSPSPSAASDLRANDKSRKPRTSSKSGSHIGFSGACAGDINS